MSYEAWKNKTKDFKKLDVRNVQGNFFPVLKKKATELSIGDGLLIIQTFEPLPLYEVMESLGYEHHMEEISEKEYNIWFYRAKGSENFGNFDDRPVSFLKLQTIGGDVARIAVDLWNNTWDDQNHFLDKNTRLMISIANAVGSGRYDYAAKELLRAYVMG